MHSQGGVLEVYMTGGVPIELHNANPKKIHKPEILDPKKYLASVEVAFKTSRIQTNEIKRDLKQKGLYVQVMMNPGDEQLPGSS